MDIVVAITLFVLALLIGVEVIGKVPATLHTPLMSGANSIHGIVIAGVVIVAAHATSPLAWVFIFLAAVLGTMNVVGGYVVTDRMLEMFKSDKGKKKEEEAKVNGYPGRNAEHAARRHRMVRLSAGRSDVRHRPAPDELPEDRPQGQHGLRHRHGVRRGHGLHRAVRR